MRKPETSPEVRKFLLEKRLEAERHALLADRMRLDLTDVPIRRGKPPRAPRPTSNPPQSMPDVVSQMEANMRRGWPRKD